jgi:hypothetical protein
MYMLYIYIYIYIHVHADMTCEEEEAGFLCNKAYTYVYHICMYVSYVHTYIHL